MNKGQTHKVLLTQPAWGREMHVSFKKELCLVINNKMEEHGKERETGRSSLGLPGHVPSQEDGNS